ncbi:MAG: DUF1329 domain-containing protein [Trinickia sp.]
MKTLKSALMVAALSAIGAAANAQSVPTSVSHDAPTSGWAPGKLRGDYWKYKGEKPLFSITAANLGQYADKLSPGQLALFKQIKNYQMDVYPTHRNCAYPEWVQDNTRKNGAGAAKLDASGDYLMTAVLPGLPFPQAKTGQEAIWNYLTRYRGVGVEWQKVNTSVSPRPGSTDWVSTTSKQTQYFAWGKKGANVTNKDTWNYAIYFAYDTPAALAGQGLIQVSNFGNNDLQSYYYFSGQRRVRRMPAYAYDAPQIGFENQYAVDEPYLFNGNIDRFDWKLVGQKDLYVPYNDFAMYDFKKNPGDVFMPDQVDPSARRYELHRVFVVEATLKPNMRHISQKKVLYLDEDTYLALVGEDYDAQGKLWKTKESYPIPIWELGGTCDVEPFVQYNLISGRYVLDQNVVGTGADVRYFEESTAPAFNPGFYTAENLRAISER